MVIAWGRAGSPVSARRKRTSANGIANTCLRSGSRVHRSGKYDRAIERFTDVVSMKGSRADAARITRRGRRTVGAARRGARDSGGARQGPPKSRYLTQGKALEAEVRRNSGQPVRPESESDEN